MTKHPVIWSIKDKAAMRSFLGRYLEFGVILRGMEQDIADALGFGIKPEIVIEKDDSPEGGHDELILWIITYNDNVPDVLRRFDQVVDRWDHVLCRATDGRVHLNIAFCGESVNESL